MEDIKILCVFLAFKNVNIIKRSFDSLSNNNLNIDFFIIENPSKNSALIEEYFNTKNVCQYIRFENNTWGSTFGIVFKKFYDFFQNYDYITFTDGDLVFDNTNNLYEEIINNLNKPNVAVCASDLKLSNLPNIPGSKKWVPTGPVENGYISKKTGLHMVTIKKSNLNLFKGIRFVDNSLYQHIIKHKLKWVATLNNKGYHLTWDLYKPGNEYLQFKRSPSGKPKKINDCKFKIITDGKSISS
jgi:hypothetical protein